MADANSASALTKYPPPRFCPSDFEPERFNGGCEYSVTFKLPIYMPAWMTLQRWPIENGSAFALRDSQGEKPHFTGTLKSLR